MIRFSLFLPLLIAWGAMQAQDIHWGPRLGLNISNVKVNDFKDGSLTRLHVGVFAFAALTEKWEAQTELIYSQQGTYQHLALVTGPVSMNYFNIPLLAKYRPIPLLATYAGPQVGVAIARQLKSDETGRIYDMSTDVKTLDLGLLFGAEYEVYQGLNAGIRYAFSLMDTHPDETKISKNRVFQFTVAYDLHGHRSPK